MGGNTQSGQIDLDWTTRKSGEQPCAGRRPTPRNPAEAPNPDGGGSQDPPPNPDGFPMASRWAGQGQEGVLCGAVRASLGIGDLQRQGKAGRRYTIFSGSGLAIRFDESSRVSEALTSGTRQRPSRLRRP